MEAGRELDALVAEKVMDLNVQPCRKIGEPLAIANEAGHFKRFIPHYSTDIAAAWTVVERLASSEKWLDIEYIAGEWAVSIGWNTAKTWFTTDGEKMDGLEEHNVEDRADTAPLAICLAALKAVQP